jgi:hypothetical protein
MVTGTDVEDQVHSEGFSEELVVMGGGYRRDFVSGELGELDSVLSNR